jgi:hypothetical protein
MAGEEASKRRRRDFRGLRERLEKRLEADPLAREQYETARQAMRDALSVSSLATRGPVEHGLCRLRGDERAGSQVLWRLRYAAGG